MKGWRRWSIAMLWGTVFERVVTMSLSLLISKAGCPVPFQFCLEGRLEEYSLGNETPHSRKLYLLYPVQRLEKRVGGRAWDGWRALSVISRVTCVHFFDLTVLSWALVLLYMPRPFSGVSLLFCFPCPLRRFFKNSFFKTMVKLLSPFLRDFLKDSSLKQNWPLSPFGVSLTPLNHFC